MPYRTHRESKRGARANLNFRETSNPSQGRWKHLTLSCAPKKPWYRPAQACHKPARAFKAYHKSATGLDHDIRIHRFQHDSSLVLIPILRGAKAEPCHMAFGLSLAKSRPAALSSSMEAWFAI